MRRRQSFRRQRQGAHGFADIIHWHVVVGQDFLALVRDLIRDDPRRGIRVMQEHAAAPCQQGRVYGALLVAMLVVCCVCAESGRV